MSICISVIRERQEDERRVALTPAVAGRLTQLDASLSLEEGAGEAAQYADALYKDASVNGDLGALVAGADILLAVQPPTVDTVTRMKPGSVLISFVHAQQHKDLVASLRDRRISCFAMELVPRISRAQALDALSSQAALAGYYAPLLGAVQLPRILPMMTTAVGSLRAAKVLVMGLGVAGLQALATARRLGAITEGYDVRSETAEQARSLGAKFVDTGIDARGEGGYARELSPVEQAQVEAALTRHVAEADMIITTASVPGRPAPRLISAAQVAGMKAGAVIVDLGADGGGNVEGTRPGETVKVGPVTILGPVNVPSMLAEHASELYARNIFSLLQLIVKDGAIAIDLADEVIAGTLLTHDGRIVNEAARKLLEGDAR